MKALISLIQPAFDWTCKNSLQVALLVGLVVLVQTVLARWLTPRLRYALSLLILLRLLLPAVPSSPLSLENLFRPAARLEAHSLAPERGRLGQTSLPEAALPDGPVTPTLAEPAPVAPTAPLPVVTPFVATPPSRLPALSVAEVLGPAWACGLLALVSLASWRYAQWCRLIRQGRRLSDPRLLALLDDARESMGVRRPVTLVAMARLGSPAVFGFRRVRLLLPETMLDQLTDQDLRLLFLHEMAHVRRHDMLLNLLLMAVQFVHWFNPLVWLGLHRLRADRELVCDYMVLQRTKPEDRLGYGSLLLKLLTDFPATQAIVPTAVPVVSSKRELKRRIILIKHPRGASLVARLVSGLAALALACLTFTGSSQQPARLPESGVRHEGPPASADVRFRELARLNDLLARFAPYLSLPEYRAIPDFNEMQQLRQSADRLRLSLYESGDLVSLTLWIPDLQPLQLHSLLQGIMASQTGVYDGWSFSVGDDMLTMLVRPGCVALVKSDFCCMTNRVPWGKLRQIGGSRDDAVFRLPDGREIGLDDCQKWLNESIVGGWMVGIAAESRRPGHLVINAMRKKAGIGATSTGSSQQSPEVPHPAASEDLSKNSVTDRPVAETRFYRLRSPEQPSPAQTNRTSNLTMRFTNLDRAITNQFKGSRYLIDYERNLVVACGTPEQLDVMDTIIRDTGFAASLTPQQSAEAAAARKLTPSAPTLVPQTAANQRVTSGPVASNDLAERPTLRFLAWRDEWQTNQPGAAWHPDGSPVTNPTELNWLRQVKPADPKASLIDFAPQVEVGTNLVKLPRRPLYLWFSYPSRTPIAFDRLSLGIPTWGPEPAATSSQEPNYGNGGLGWSTACLLTRGLLNIPPRLTVALEYTAGPLERVKDVAITPGLVTPIPVDDGAAVKGYGQDDKERAFIAIAVDAEKIWSRRFDVIAVAKDGREITSIPRVYGDTAKPASGVVKFEFNLPVAEVAKFRIGSRPIRTRQWSDVVMAESKQDLYGDTRQRPPAKKSQSSSLSQPESLPGVPLLIQGRPIADWVKEAEISVRPGKEGERALRVLENAGPPIMPQLGRLLVEDKSPEIQAKAALAMSVIGYHNPDAPEVHSAVPVLTTAAQNKSSEVRIYSVQALGAIGRAASNAVPVLIRLTRDENDGVRMSAVEALGRIGATSPESVEALTAAASDASSDVRITARKALIVAQGGKASPLMTSNEAGSLAEHLANEKAQALYNCQPFRNSPPARFVRDHWTWHRLKAQGLGDIEATVELAADGAEPKVTVVRLVSIPRTP